MASNQLDGSRKFLKRFWKKVRFPSPESLEKECWVWTSTQSKGYGKFGIDGRHHRAHRISYEMSNGLIGDEEHVLHSCDNPSCVSPFHLRSGSHQENMKERDQRGRAAKLRGSAHGMSRLTESKVRDIRRLLKEGTPRKEIASSFGVSGSLVGQIALGTIWAHV